jgi:ribosome-associated protein
MLQITPEIAIDENELLLEFVRSSGPGGQNINKVATAVKLSFDVANSPSLPEDIRRRLFTQAGRRITEKGVLMIDARRFRTQLANRQDAIRRLVEMVGKAAEKPPIRRKTRPTPSSKIRRLETKHRRSQTKRLRVKPLESDE